ncbi:putative Gamma-butyrobetaine hydroxylase subfamily [Aspergillus lucknowensis]|uniref:TauD/TfdA-like domain-containing protein n=1 Tax=Aspergillus lucknowensis TaxID=176173 RepID=A0ABR4L8S8_9EURO
MVRALLRAPLRFRRITVPTAPVLSRRYSSDPVDQAVNTPSTTNQEYPAQFTSNDFVPEKKAEIKGISFGQETLTLETNGRPCELSFIRLRDGCKCPLCVDVHSKQRKFRFSDIPLDIKANSFQWDGKSLALTWNKDVPGFKASHVTRYDAKELHYAFDRGYKDSVGLERHRTGWNKDSMKSLQHWISYEDYMHDNDKFAIAMRFLATLGLVFVKGIPDSREMVEKIATRMGPVRDSFYGRTWDVRTVPQARNVAYTNQFLGFHMDLMYMNDPPGFQLLHCLRNSCDGGESLFADTFRIAAVMKTNNRHYFDILANTSLTYEYQHKDNSYQNTWPVFEARPTTNPLNTVTHVNYSPPFQGFRQPEPGAKLSIPREQEELAALSHFARLLESEQNIFELKLQPGECVIFENRRVVHARRQFNTTSGERWLAGAYVDEDAVLSRFQVLKESNPVSWDKLTLGLLRLLPAKKLQTF